jgi:hypothetical protein
VNLLAPADVRPRFDSGRFQGACAIQEIRFGNGERWSSPPAVIFARTHPEVSRAFLGRDTSGNPAFCRDEKGAEYSQGALIGIALEPGRRARCAAGIWAEQEIAGGAPFARLDFVLPSGHRPSIGVEPGKMARLDLGSGSWGFLPTVDPSQVGQIRLEVYDLNVEPRVRVAELRMAAGDPPVAVPGVGLTVQFRATR